MSEHDRHDDEQAIRPAPRSGSVEQRARLVRSEDDAELQGPSADDRRRFDGHTQVCPNCRKAVFDDTDVCYHCGEAITRRTSGPKPWILIVVGLMIAALVLGTVLRL